LLFLEPPSNTVERRNTEERMSKSLDLSKESTKARHSTAKPSTQQQQQQQQQPQRAPRTTASTPAALTDKEGKFGNLKRLIDSSY